MFDFLKRKKSKKSKSNNNDTVKAVKKKHNDSELDASDEDNEQSTNISLGKLSVHDSDDSDTDTKTTSTKSKPTVKSPVKQPTVTSPHSSSTQYSDNTSNKLTKLQQRLVEEQKTNDTVTREQLPPYFTVERTKAINDKHAQYYNLHNNDIQLYQYNIQQQLQSIQQQISELPQCSEIVNLSQFTTEWLTTPQPQPEKRNVEKQRVFIYGIYKSLYQRNIGRNFESNTQKAELTIQQNEQLFLYCSLEPAILLKQQKITDFTLNCLVLTNKRMIQLNNGDIVHECVYGQQSGNIVKIVKSKQSSDTGNIQVTIQIKSVLNNSENDENTDHTNNKRNKTSKSVVLFDMPSIDVRDYFSEYITVQHTLQTTDMSIKLLQNQQQYTIQQIQQQHIISGWTVLLKSFAGPAIFSATKLHMYENLCKQACINAREAITSNKNLDINIKSIKLLNFYVPPIEAYDLESLDVTLDSDGRPRYTDGTLLKDQIPELKLKGYQFIPYYEYLFDYNWSLEQFNATILITGKKLFKFKLQLTLSKLSISGECRLRTNPYDTAEQISISFVQTPNINFCIESHMIVSNSTLPLSWQAKITKLIQEKIQTSITKLIEQQLNTNEWIHITLTKSKLYQLLDTWYSVYKYPFMFDGSDDIDMMSYVLSATTQAECELSEMCNAMRALREKLTRFVNLNEPTADNT